MPVAARLAGQPMVSLSDVPAGFVQGSQWLRYEDMYRGRDVAGWLFRPPDHTITEDGVQQAGRGSLDDLVRRIGSRTSRRLMLVVGRPDTGKTTLAYALLRRINLDPRRAGVRPAGGGLPASLVVPLARYAQEYQRWPNYFGTRLWMRSTGPAARPARRPGQEPLLVLDGLDDLVRHADMIGIESLLGRALFTDAAVLTCSEALFDKIRALDAVRSACIVELDGLGVGRRLEFARRYIAAVPLAEHGEGAVARRERLARDAERAIRRDEAGEATFREPLQLIIELEKLWRGEGQRVPQLDYYVSSTLEQELATGARRLPAVQLLGILGALAARLSPFEAGPVPMSPPRTAYLTASASADFVRQFAERLELAPLQLVDELAHCRFVQLRPGGIGMRGNQFRDYFLALDIMGDLMSPAPGQSVSERFVNLLPGAVVGHLTEELQCIQRSEELRGRIVERLWTALEEATRELALLQVVSRRETQFHLVRQRVVCEQLGYYLAVVVGPGAEGEPLQALVAGKSSMRDDPWIRRGVVVGLGLGGRKDVISAYVDELWAERSAHDGVCCAGGECTVGSNRQVNVEFNIVLFGDAGPRHGEPDRCEHPAGCTRTLSGMLDLLETQTNAELCRLVLFIILDLYHYHWNGDPAKNLREQWCAAFAPSRAPGAPSGPDEPPGEDISWPLRDRLEDSLDRFIEEGANWAEIAALQQLLGDVVPAGRGGGDAGAGHA